ncbi:unnamed protein product [Phytomonas sp. EM1]|nr:unnamed protein product [Phytomonas sp. EM1]|eukprot:CCW62872.1 unnamed protein product [Phytomonas sp. isolate EM1]
MEKDNIYTQSIERAGPTYHTEPKESPNWDDPGDTNKPVSRSQRSVNSVNTLSSGLVINERGKIGDGIKSPAEDFKKLQPSRFNSQDKITINHTNLSSDPLDTKGKNNNTKHNSSLIECQREGREFHRASMSPSMENQLIEKRSASNNASLGVGNFQQVQLIYKQYGKESPDLSKRSMAKVSFRNIKKDSISQKTSEQGQYTLSNEEQGVTTDLQRAQPTYSNSLTNLTASRDQNPLSNGIGLTPCLDNNSFTTPLGRDSSIFQCDSFCSNIIQCETQHSNGGLNHYSKVINVKPSTQTELLIGSMDQKNQNDQGVGTQPQNWLQNPILFYLFENLIKLHELRTKLKPEGLNEASSALRVGGPSSTALGSSVNYERQAQMETLKRYITYSVSEIDATLLNPLFTLWSEKPLRDLLKRVTASWKGGGLDSKDFDEASFLLLQAISEERSGTIRYTLLYRLREYFGSAKHHSTGLCLLSVMSFISLLCVILLALFADLHYAVRIVLPILMSISIFLIFCFVFLILNHNASADATAAFFKMEILYLSNDNVSEELEDSFLSSSRSSLCLVTPSNECTPSPYKLNVIDDNVRPKKDLPIKSVVVGNDEANSTSIARKLPHRMQMEHQEHPENSKQSGAPMRSYSFERQRHAEHSQQVFRRIVKTNTFAKELFTDNAQASDTNGVQNNQNSNLQDAEASCTTINSTFIIDLADNISVTALIYCKDQYALSIMMPSLWEFNFLVLETEVSQIDNVYQQGTDKFKIIILHAADLHEGTIEFDMALSWVKENLPVFFFSRDNSRFPDFVPESKKVQLPLSEKDITTLLLFGTGKNEGMNSARMGCPSNLIKVPAYALGRRLGGGAYGNVFEAEMEETGVMCAVKRIYLRSGNNSDQDDNSHISQLRDIAREVEIMSSLTHPNIVQYMFCERDDNCISIFMELCLGGSLSSLINGVEIVDTDFMKQLLRDIISAVAYLHRKKVAHRDLKPDNVLFSNSRAKLTDFGTAILKRNHDNLSPVTGTFAYMAPEIILCETYGKACDMWSIGCIAAEVLKVDLPQRSLGLPGMCEFYRKMDFNSSLSIDCGVQEVDNFLRSCLQRNPNARPTATELLHHDCLKHNNTAFDRWMKQALSKRNQAHPHGALVMDLFGSNESIVDLNSQLNAVSLKSLDEAPNV